MEFILVLASVFLLSHSRWLAKLQQDEWLEAAKALSYGLPIPKTAADILLVGVPLLIVFTIVNKLGGHWLGLLSFLVAAVVFFYSLGRNKHESHIAYFQERLEHDDQQGAFNAVNVLIPETEIENYPQLQVLFEKVLLHYRFDRWFVVVFWFLLVGPVGALGYRVLAMLQATESDDSVSAYNRASMDDMSQDKPSASHVAGSVPNASHSQPSYSQTSLARCLYYLEWIPARLLGMSFGLMGQLSGFGGHLQSALAMKEQSTDCLHNCAMLAMEATPVAGDMDSASALLRVKAIERLARHSMIMWVALIAFVQLLA